MSRKKMAHGKCPITPVNYLFRVIASPSGTQSRFCWRTRLLRFACNDSFAPPVSERVLLKASLQGRGEELGNVEPSTTRWTTVVTPAKVGFQPRIAWD
jgi:hypothetical protein